MRGRRNQISADTATTTGQPLVDNIFIVSTSATKPQGAARQIIRRHVMRGKNRRKRIEPMKAGSWVSASRQDDGHDAAATAMASPLYPPRPMPCSALQTWRYPVPMEPHMLEGIFRFCTILKQSLYPIELCCRFDPMNSFWLEYLSNDEAYIHSCLWTVEAYGDFLKARPFSRATLYHESMTLHLLQQRLNDPSRSTSDFSLAVVVTLVMMTCLTGSHAAMIKHMRGLHQMVMLRGGLKHLRSNTQMQIKVCRADLCTALITGARPLFFSEGGISTEPFLPRPEHVPSFFASHPIDARLATVSADLSQFCASANIAFRSNLKMDPALFQEILISIQYRLLVVDFDTHGFNEALRVGLLAFSTNVFLQTPELKIRFSALSRDIRSAVSGLDWEDECCGGTRLWILFMAAITAVTDHDDGWLVPQLGDAIRATGCSSWEDCLLILKKFLWIGVLMDAPGMRVFRKAQAPDGGTSHIPYRPPLLQHVE